MGADVDAAAGARFWAKATAGNSATIRKATRIRNIVTLPPGGLDSGPLPDQSPYDTGYFIGKPEKATAANAA
jgi:hypothetical protein